ncbi:hypothetical protein AB0O01_09970 [Streptomyces sp. NPDC093252]|uniref:hypothetical protein n=1 Tax=Streptomyces sp. NPDC093252 TaxID=3154980 RepID=UPI003442E932
MRAIRVGSAALLAVGALSLTAPVAQARGEEESRLRVSVAPQTIAAGGRVTLRAEGCERSVRVSSGVFDDVHIERDRGTAVATIDREARKGAVYEVSFHCGNFRERAQLTIAEGRGSSYEDGYDDGGGGYDSGYDRESEDSYGDYPQRGVHAGEGGSFGGFDLKEIGLGAALIAGSVGVAYHLSRRRSAEQGG